MRTLHAALFLLIASTAAIAAEPQWTEVRSPNFAVITDAGPKKGREVALRFEQLRAVFGTLTGNKHVSTPVPLQILAFKRKKDFVQIAPLYNGKPIQAAGLFVSGGERNFIALDLSQHDPWSIVYHEYAHMLLDANFPRTQPWFDEGFASYYAGIEVGKKSARIGTDPNYYGPQLSKSSFMPIVELFSVTQQSRDYNEGSRRSLFYAQSWLVVHYLFDTNKVPQASRYFTLVLKENVPIPEAIRQAFGMTAQEFDRDLRDYFSSTRALIHTIDTPAGLNELAFDAKPLDALDARAAIADMRLHHPDYIAAAAEDFKAILAERPQHAAAHRGLGYFYMRSGQWRNAAEHFRAAAASDSQDPQVHYYLGMLIPAAGEMNPEQLAEMKRALETAIRLKPDFADAYNLLAFARGVSQDYSGAAEAMEQAVKLAPREEKYSEALARYYMHLKRWDEAEQLWQSLSSSSNPTVATGARQNLEWLAETRQRPAQARAGISDLAMRRRGSSPTAAPEPREPEAAPEAAPAVTPAPVKFLKGTLLDVACNAETGGAVLRVEADGRIWTMLAPDAKKTVVIGAGELDCSWTKRKVALNYRERGDAGEIVSLELQ